MKFSTWKLAIMSFRLQHEFWCYSPNTCENHFCCGEEFGHENHGTIELNGHRQAIVICDDCLHQVQNKTYEKELRV